MEHLPAVILDLAILFLVASGVAVLFQKIRQPVIIGYIIAGIIIGPYTSGLGISDPEQLKGLSELGVIFLMFSIGLEFSFHRLKELGLPAIITAIIKSTGLVLLGFYFGRWLGWGRYTSLFFGSAIAFSSTTIIFKALEDLNLRRKRFADLICGILVVEDLLAVLILTALTTVVETHNIFSFRIVLAGLKLILVIGSWFFIGYYLTPSIFRRIIHYVTQETITLVSIALCLGLSVIFSYFHYSTALGAFIMGSILAETPHLAHRIKGLINPLRDVFAAIFFVSVGMGIDLGGFALQWKLIILSSILLTFFSITITFLGTFFTGNGWRNGLRVGFSIVPIGEFSFIILALGVTLKVVDVNLYQVIVGIATLTTLFTPYLIQVTNQCINFLELSWSDNFKQKLDHYSQKIYQFLAYQEQAGYRRLLLKYFLNISAISGIFMSVKYLILPNLITIFHSPNLMVISWGLAMLIISPFIWNLLTNYYFLPLNKQNFAKIISVLITLLTLVIFSIAFFEVWYVAVGVASGLLLILLVFRRFWGNLLHLIEQKVASQGTDGNNFDVLELIDTPLSEVRIDHPELVGKSLATLHFRQKYGLDVVSIQRNDRILDKPKGKFILKTGDLLTIMGKPEQVNAFRQLIQGEVSKGYVLQTILVDESSSLISSKINDLEQLKGRIVGIERRGMRLLNLDPTTILCEGDVLLVVVPPEKE